MQEDLTRWLPTNKKEVEIRGWDTIDVILFSGDAYVDHPAFGSAVIGRIIESMGYRVAIIPQPNWRDDLRDFKKLGKPRLFFGVTSGCMDSMVNHYTASRRRRSTDAYSPDGKSGFRPDYATTVYTKILKSLFPDVPVLIGGIEASLRRVTHYDYWKDELLPSILVDSEADMLIYGMGEQPLRKLVRLLDKGVPFSSIDTLEQTAFLVDDRLIPKNKNWQDKQLESHETCLQDKKKFASNFKIVEQESNNLYASRLLQKVGSKTLVINPPFQTMTETEIDASFDLPYTRRPHPKYNKRDSGSQPAYRHPRGRDHRAGRRRLWRRRQYRLTHRALCRAGRDCRVGTSAAESVQSAGVYHQIHWAAGAQRSPTRRPGLLYRLARSA